jgi:polysaccharide chain length determinant protein (PEP-CTERM system associated)
MDELIRQVVTALRGMWRRRWVGLGVAWMVALVGGAAVFTIPDRYEASVRVFVDTQSILKPLMSGLAVQPDRDQRISILSKTLISRPNMEKLIRMTDLDLTSATPKEREQLVETLLRDVKLTGSERENLYKVSYRSPRPSEAERVVQALMSIFVESSLGQNRQGSDAARRFIEEQIKAYEAKLEEAENRLKEFKLKHLGLLGPGGPDYFAKLTALGEELSRARLELRSAEQGRDALKRELAGEEPLLIETQTPAGQAVISSEIDPRIDTLRRSLDELLRRFTDQHPDVVGTRRIIEQLEVQRQQELDARKKATPAAKAPVAPSTNPVYQQLKVSLAESEANVASLQGRVAELDARYRQLQASAKLRPQVETELAQLNRDYDVQKRNYESLVSRRESAALTTEMDATTGVAEFRIVDPPSVSKNPVAPNRLLLLPVMFLVALGTGVFASFVISQILPTFHDAGSLRDVAQRLVLGTVMLYPSPQMTSQRRRNVALFAGGLTGLVGVFGSAMVLVSMGISVI